MIQGLLVLLGYIIGACPTAYAIGYRMKGKDIRRLGDGNMGARNAYHELGHKIGILIFFIDTAKGYLAIFIAQFFGASQVVLMATGVAAVAGHNWPVFLGFRGGRGEAATIGILLALIPKSMLIVAVPTIAVLLIKKNVILTSAVLFISLPLVGWWQHIPGIWIVYGIALPILVAITHYFRARHVRKPIGTGSA
ncbi:MAG: glycerol-3-phosphate acyltransferase [Dehalococcoidales bacterium]|nr:glycerol-3-phosphate acyltransferase [Dehalococcoidales bacterium]